MTVLLTTTLATTPAEAGKRNRPDLRTTAVTLSATTVAAGAEVRLTDKAKNAGRRRAGGSTTGYWLSTDAKRSSDDVSLGSRRVKKLRPGRSHRGRTDLTIPADARGSYRVVACADVRRKVREAKEGNNCHASGPLTVTVPDQPPGGSTWGGADPTLRVLDRGNDRVLLSWPAVARDTATTGFRLTWNGGQQVLEPNTMNTEVTGLTPGASYSFTLTAIRGGTALDEPLSASATTSTDLQEPPDLTITTGRVDTGEVGGRAFGDPDGIGGSAVLFGEEWEYVLEVPRGALPGQETIRMSEVVSVEGVSTSGGLVAGVRFEPSGLVLAKPATLVIRPRLDGAETPAGVIPLIFSGDGADAQLAVIDPLAPEYRIKVSHFSGVVLMQGTHEELTALVDNAETEIGRITNEASALFATEHARIASEGGELDAAVVQQFEAHVDAAWDQALLMLQAATTDDRLATRAISTAMSLARDAALAGLDTTRYDADLDRYFPLIIQNAYDAANARCKVNLDPREVRNMLIPLRYGEMMGMPLQADPADLDACLSTSIQLDLDVTTLAFDVPETAGVCCRGLSRSGGTVKASVELTPIRDSRGQFPYDGPVYGGVATPDLSGMVADKAGNMCFVRVGAPLSSNAIPLLASPSINPTVDPDAPARIRLEISDFWPVHGTQPYFRTEFDVTYSHVDPDNGCGPTVTVQGDAWNGFPESFGGIDGPWHLDEGTTTFTTASDQYLPTNIGGSASLSFTVTPQRDGID